MKILTIAGMIAQLIHCINIPKTTDYNPVLENMEIDNNSNFKNNNKPISNDTKLPSEIEIKVRQALTKEVKENKTPGIQYAIVDTHDNLFQFSHGKANIESNIDVTEKTTFQAFSVTKIFTSLAILQLVDRGILKLDDKVSKYLPENPYNKNITLKHLLNHTSGIPNPLPLKWVHPVEEEFDYKKFVQTVLKENPEMKSDPGLKMNYSNVEYLLLGEIIEVVSGMEFKEYIQKNILDKADIPRQDLDFIIHKDSQLADGYIKKYSLLNFALGFLIDKKSLIAGEEKGWLKFKKFYLNGPAYGGLIGNTKGLTKFLRVLLNENNNLISEKNKSLLFTKSTLDNGDKIDMSLGWFYGELNGIPYYTHPGGGGGYYSEIRIYPTRKIGTAIMFNKTVVSDDRFLDTIDKLFLDKLY